MLKFHNPTPLPRHVIIAGDFPGEGLRGKLALKSESSDALLLNHFACERGIFRKTSLKSQLRAWK
jgi:hypothetical protein